MKVLLDTSDRFEKKLSIKQKHRSHVTCKTYKDIFSLLKSKISDPSKITKVSFNPGPGSFTGLRVGSAIANALRYGLRLAGPKDILVPKYGGKLNITK